MTVNVEGLIPCKAKPTGSPGDPDLTLSMMKEELYLAFKREGTTLFSIELFLQNEKKANYKFPNKLPSLLQPEMVRSWVHTQFAPLAGSSLPGSGYAKRLATLICSQ